MVTGKPSCQPRLVCARLWRQCHFAPETRTQRAGKARAETHQHFNDRQQAFLALLLAQCVSQGAEEMDTDKLTPLLRLKFHNAISDAAANLGDTAKVRAMFAGFQKCLYADCDVGQSIV